MVLAGRIERYILCGKRALASSFVFMYFCKYLSLLIANATQFRLFPQLNRELSPAQVIASTSKSRLKPRASDSAKIAAKARKEKENEEKSELKSGLNAQVAQQQVAGVCGERSRASSCSGVFRFANMNQIKVRVLTRKQVKPDRPNILGMFSYALANMKMMFLPVPTVDQFPLASVLFGDPLATAHLRTPAALRGPSHSSITSHYSRALINSSSRYDRAGANPWPQR